MWLNVHDTVKRILAVRGYTCKAAPTEAEVEDMAEKGDKSDLCFEADHPTAPTVLVYYNNDKKIGIRLIRHLLSIMEQRASTHAISVFTHAPTPFAKRYLADLKDVRIECFFSSDLVFDITQHVLMPKHRKLSTTEKERVLDQYGRETAMYPKILLDDPMARYLGLQAGDMVHVQRSIPYLGSRPMYRLAFANAS